MQIVKELIKRGVDVTAKNEERKTALEIAESINPLQNYGNIHEVRNILRKVSNVSSTSTHLDDADNGEDLMLSDFERWKICINRYKANIMSNDISVLLILALLIILWSLLVALL